MSAGPTTFGKYFLAEKLATGGMAEIYLAKLLGPGGFEKLLVVKQIHPRFGNRPEFVDLFVREAKTLVSLSHGNIVPVYELGVIDGTYFIAMEYIDGPTLAELMDAAPRRGLRIEPPMAAFIAAEIVKGLDYAHRKGTGVIHRDLSPRNVMISRDGEVKLVDFGIAATVGDDFIASGTDQPVGSFPYMSPEQVRREPLAPSSDLFSAGILLWEMLAGRRLFARDTPEATLEAVCSADIPAPSQLNPDVPSALDAVCARALERDPARRIPSAAEFHAKLTRYLYSLDAPVTAHALSALVARACPPEVRSERRPATASATPNPNDARPVDDTHPVDGTRPLPGRARGKRRGQTQTFATHAGFREVLERATPLFPIDAIDPRGTPAPDAPDDARQTSPPATDTAGAAHGDAAAPATRSESLPAVGGATAAARGRRRRPALWISAALVLIAGAAVAALWPPAPGGRPTAPTTPFASASAVRADAALPTVDAAPATRAPRTDGGRVTDAAEAATRRRRADAALARATGGGARRPVRPDAAVRARQFGTLIVGADPWGKVYVDDQYVGEAPLERLVPAGAHRVRVVGPDGVTARTFDVDVPANGQARAPFADFTR